MLWLLEHCACDSAALRGFLLDVMADALGSALAVAGKAPYWTAVEDAHRQVREAIAGRGDLAAAMDAARAAARAAGDAARAAMDAAGGAAGAAARAAAWAAGAAAGAAWDAARAARDAAVGAARAAKAVRAAKAAWDAAPSRHADLLRKHFPKPPKMQPVRTAR